MPRELITQQTLRQDLVDNAVYRMLNTVWPPEADPPRWDMELIGQVRDAVEEVVVARTGMTRVRFYPSLDDEPEPADPPEADEPPQYIDPETYIFNFGKNIGRSFFDVVAVDAQYALWAHESVPWFVLSDKDLETVKAKAAEQKANRRPSNGLRREDVLEPDDEMPF